MAETSGLLNRRTGYSRTEGSNPSVSAKALGHRAAAHTNLLSSGEMPDSPDTIQGATVAQLRPRTHKLS